MQKKEEEEKEERLTSRNSIHDGRVRKEDASGEKKAVKVCFRRQHGRREESTGITEDVSTRTRTKRRRWLRRRGYEGQQSGEISVKGKKRGKEHGKTYWERRREGRSDKALQRKEEKGRKNMKLARGRTAKGNNTKKRVRERERRS